MKCIWLLAAAALVLPARTIQNLEYTTVAGTPLTLDGYIPDGPGPHPTAIVVHGGAWVTGDKRAVRPVLQPLADAGFAWFSINYRLARGSSIDALISLEGLAQLTNASDDVRSAVDFIRSHAEEWKLDPARIALIGESAGAHLVSMAGLRPEPVMPVQAVVAFYSPSDLVDLAEHSPRIPQALKNMLEGSPLAQILLGGLRQISPQTWVNAAAPPFLMIHGTADALVPFSQSEKMCSALSTAGAMCELFPVPGAGHGFNRWEGQTALTAYKERMIGWLKATLGIH